MADKDVQVFEVIFNLFSSQSKTFESQTVAFERLFLFVLFFEEMNLVTW